MAISSLTVGCWSSSTILTGYCSSSSTALFPSPSRTTVPFSSPGAPVYLRCCAVSKPETKKREPRGITKPRPISPAMQELLGVPEIPRTQALKEIWAYIKQNNLQDPENKKIIVCDEKLKNIFGGRERVGFLEVSGLINPHFVKSEV